MLVVIGILVVVPQERQAPSLILGLSWQFATESRQFDQEADSLLPKATVIAPGSWRLSRSRAAMAVVMVEAKMCFCIPISWGQYLGDTHTMTVEEDSVGYEGGCPVVGPISES